MGRSCKETHCVKSLSVCRIQYKIVEAHGSVLVPFLFVNPKKHIHKVSDEFHAYLFADDSKITIFIYEQTVQSRYNNLVIHNIHEWLAINKQYLKETTYLLDFISDDAVLRNAFLIWKSSAKPMILFLNQFPLYLHSDDVTEMACPCNLAGHLQEFKKTQLYVVLPKRLSVIYIYTEAVLKCI